ncbi:MAG: hypothetical protein LC777_01990 [Actinobacteria bacterium]|nr:hypothetical protein [Actinomycetota bacterium]
MRARIEAEIGEEWRRVQASTFHSFCLDVLGLGGVSREDQRFCFGNCSGRAVGRR